MLLTLYIDLKSHYNSSFKGYFILLWLFTVYHCLFYFSSCLIDFVSILKYLLLLCVLSLFDLVVLDLKFFCIVLYGHIHILSLPLYFETGSLFNMTSSVQLGWLINGALEMWLPPVSLNMGLQRQYHAWLLCGYEWSKLRSLPLHTRYFLHWSIFPVPLTYYFAIFSGFIIKFPQREHLVIQTILVLLSVDLMLCLILFPFQWIWWNNHGYFHKDGQIFTSKITSSPFSENSREILLLVPNKYSINGDCFFVSRSPRLE